jgi:hypothetical protein
MLAAQARERPQQIRGNCSLKGKSSTRLPPISVFSKTMPGWAATASPMMPFCRHFSGPTGRHYSISTE